MIGKEMDSVDPKIIWRNICNRRDLVASEFARTQRHIAAGRAVVNYPQAEKYLSGLSEDLKFMANLIERFRPKLPQIYPENKPVPTKKAPCGTFLENLLLLAFEGQLNFQSCDIKFSTGSVTI